MLLEYGLKLNKDIKFIRRFWTIVETIVSYGFHELAGDIHPFRKLFVKKRSELMEKSREDRLCLLLEELGPTFVKFGQILSTRKDLVGEKYANALKKLTDNVEPFSSLEAINILEEELGEKLDTLFSFRLKSNGLYVLSTKSFIGIPLLKILLMYNTSQ